MTVEIQRGKTYQLWGRVEGMIEDKPIGEYAKGRWGFVENGEHAEPYEVEHLHQLIAMFEVLGKLEAIGSFEFREVEG